MCNISGSQEQTQAAYNMAQELVENTAVRTITTTTHDTTTTTTTSSSSSSRWTIQNV